MNRLTSLPATPAPFSENLPWQVICSSRERFQQYKDHEPYLAFATDRRSMAEILSESPAEYDGPLLNGEIGKIDGF